MMISGTIVCLKYLIYRILGSKSPATYYQRIGDDVIPFLNNQFKDRSKPLWLNLGYWKKARTYPEAGTALAKLLGERAGLSPGDRVLDVGFGFGEQDFFWLNTLCIPSAFSFLTSLKKGGLIRFWRLNPLSILMIVNNFSGKLFGF